MTTIDFTYHPASVRPSDGVVTLLPDSEHPLPSYVHVGAMVTMQDCLSGDVHVGIVTECHDRYRQRGYLATYVRVGNLRLLTL